MKHLYTILILLILGTMNNINAQWVQANGPYGGIINCVASTGKSLWAATDAGLYRSTDKGASWERASVYYSWGVTPRLHIYDVNIVDSVILIGSNFHLWISTNEGLTWKVLTSTSEGVTNANKIASCGNYIACAQNPDEDAIEGGQAFLDIYELDSTKSNLPYVNIFVVDINSYEGPSSFIRSVAFKEGLICLGTNYGIYISPDTGKTWTKSNISQEDTSIQAITIFNKKIFAATENNGIYSSSDSGKTWIPCNTGLTNMSIRTLAVNNDKIYAGTDGSGIYFSIDSGTTWNAMNAGMTNISINSICFDNDEIIAGSSSNGVYKYDGGVWTPINSGLVATYINNFTSIGSNLFAGSEGGVYRSGDEGTNWTAVNTGMGNLNISALTVKGSNLFAGTLTNGVFRSTDCGTLWQKADNGIIVKHIGALTANSDYIYAGSKAWSKIPVVFPPSAYYSSWIDSGMVYRSSDNGNNWVVVDTGLYYVNYLTAIDSNIFNGINTVVRYSTNNGLTWKNTTIPHVQFDYTLVSDLTTKDDKLYVGSYHYGIKVFNIQDTSWETINNSELYPFSGNSSTRYHIVSAMTSNDTALFVAFENYSLDMFCGLYISTDNGNNWKEITTPFVNNTIAQDLRDEPIITSLAVHGNYLFVGTNGFGVWKAPLSGIVTGVEDITNETPSKFALEQNYPNPFNPTTIIKYEMPEAGFVSLKIYDILGREVQTLVNGNKIRGTYEVSFNGSSLASGVYLYKLKAGNYTSTKKMMLIK